MVALVQLKENVLPVGDVTYPFSYALPVKLPSSFEGSYGYVRYTVRATLDRPWKFNQDAKSVFTVISHTDLNLLPQLRSPLTQTKTKSVCCLCCNTGPITMVARIPFTGFVSGQDIPLTIDMENPTRININNVNCVMMQVATFQSQQPYASFRYERRPVAKLDLGPVEHNSSKLLDGTMKIPPSPPSLLPNCNIIKLQYIIEVKATVAGPHKNMYVNLPITVGTVPLIFQENWEPSPSVPLLEPTAPAYPELPPPSYDECYFGSSNIKDQGDTQYTFGSTQYVPRYPTYNM
uniref:Arrestin C-terminal-like domain-containing protein n=1 Tax=Timema douglasi TaxID=61478 RepID=A0A7R8VT91_TIMDO|nr:unnamed protein product [Timema douglasi]